MPRHKNAKKKRCVMNHTPFITNISLDKPIFYNIAFYTQRLNSNRY